MRSRIPGSVAIGTWAPSKTMCSYTSSVTTSRSRSTHRAAMRLELLAREHAPGRVVRRVEDEEAGLRPDRGRERGRVQPELRRRQGHDLGLRQGERDARAVGVVEGLEDERLVAAVEQRGERRRDRLGGAGVDRDLLGRVVVDAVEALLVVGHRLLRARARPASGRTGCGRPRTASTAARSTKSGPSKSGKPWPRFTAPCWRASAVISAKTDVPKPERRGVSGGRLIEPRSLSRTAGNRRPVAVGAGGGVRLRSLPVRAPRPTEPSGRSLIAARCRRIRHSAAQSLAPATPPPATAVACSRAPSRPGAASRHAAVRGNRDGICGAGGSSSRWSAPRSRHVHGAEREEDQLP